MRSKKTILVIEDDHETRVAVRECLEAEGHFVVSAAHGAAALTILDEMTAPDLILLDINMPIMNGDQFLASLQRRPELARIPVVQMSAAHSPKRDGTCEALFKPLEIRRLLQIIERHSA